MSSNALAQEDSGGGMIHQQIGREFDCLHCGQKTQAIVKLPLVAFLGAKKNYTHCQHCRRSNVALVYKDGRLRVRRHRFWDFFDDFTWS